MKMTDFDLFYINLDQATGRRELIEKSFADSRFSNRWTFNRFSAVSAESEKVRNATGKLSGAYKGNFFSHVDCVRQSLGSERHLFMAEDDLEFCPDTGPVLEKIVDSVPEDSWDIIHCEITLMSARDFPMLYKMDRADNLRTKIKLIDLNSFPYPYSGSGAYVVNRRSKHTFLSVMDDAVRSCGGHLDHPFDIYLRGSLKFKALRGFLVFPFLTAPSLYADQTQAPWGNFDPTVEHVKKVHLELSNAFRRLVWLGYSADKVLPEMLAKHGHEILLLSERDKLFQKIMPWFLYLQYNAPYEDYNQLKFLPQQFPCRPGLDGPDVT
jgi:hypothetical protein